MHLYHIKCQSYWTHLWITSWSNLLYYSFYVWIVYDEIRYGIKILCRILKLLNACLYDSSRAGAEFDYKIYSSCSVFICSFTSARSQIRSTGLYLQYLTIVWKLSISPAVLLHCKSSHKVLGYPILTDYNDSFSRLVAVGPLETVQDGHQRGDES